MRSIPMSLFMPGAILALAALTPATSAESSHAFHLEKTCPADPSEPLGYFCVIQDSDFAALPAGTEIHYAAGPTPDVVHPTIRIRNGSTTGVCVFTTDVNATCTFDGGTGRLRRLHLRVDVTANADQSVWFWDGSYWFGDDRAG